MTESYIVNRKNLKISVQKNTQFPKYQLNIRDKEGGRHYDISKTLYNLMLKELRAEGMSEGKPSLVVQKALSPYLENGKTRFSIRNVPGVYLIYKNKELVYIGFSASDVYKALYRHLQSWKDKHQQRITFKSEKGITVRMVYTTSGAKARQLEGALIIKHKPPLNINKYDGFITDEKEKQLLKEFESAPKEGIYIFEGDLPF